MFPIRTFIFPCIGACTKVNPILRKSKKFWLFLSMNYYLLLWWSIDIKSKKDLSNKSCVHFWTIHIGTQTIITSLIKIISHPIRLSNNISMGDLKLMPWCYKPNSSTFYAILESWCYYVSNSSLSWTKKGTECEIATPTIQYDRKEPTVVMHKSLIL
jgi:hypothetical protein